MGMGVGKLWRENMEDARRSRHVGKGKRMGKEGKGKKVRCEERV